MQTTLFFQGPAPRCFNPSPPPLSRRLSQRVGQIRSSREICGAVAMQPESVGCSDAASADPAIVELPQDILDEIVRRGGWRTWGKVWSKTCKRYHLLEWWRQEGGERAQKSAHLVVVPDDAPTIKAAIAQAANAAEAGQRAVVLVRPGVYREAVRITADISVCALGQRGRAAVIAPGWEPALAWGGFKVGVTRMGGVTLNAASAGASSDVCGFSLVQRNQSQMVAVYCTFGTPTIAYCDVVGSVHVAGRAARPHLSDCHISNSRSAGVEFCDHAGGCVERCVIRGNRLAAVRLGKTADLTPESLRKDNEFMGNGFDGVQVRGVREAGVDDLGDDDDDDDWAAFLPEEPDSEVEVDGDMWLSEGATDSRDQHGRLVLPPTPGHP